MEAKVYQFPPPNKYRIVFYTPMMHRKESRLIMARTEGDAVKRLKSALDKEKRRYHNTYFTVIYLSE